MPSLRAMIVFILLVVMELLAGFSLLVGSGLIEAVRLGGGFLWLLLLAGIGGLVTGLGVAFLGPAEPWNRILLLVGAAPCAALPAYLAGNGGHDPAGRLFGMVLALGLLIVAYWRGIRLSLEPADTETVKRTFGLGFGLVFLAFLWGITRDVNHVHPFWSVLTVSGVAYTLTAMIALVVARLERQREPGSGLAVFVSVTIQLGILLLLAVGAIAVFGHDLAGALGNATRPFFDAAGAATYHLVTLLAAPIQWLIDLVRSQARTPHPPVLHPPRLGPRRVSGNRPHIGHANQTVLILLGALALALLLIAAGYIVWRLLPRIPRYRPARGYRDERRSLLSPADLARAFLAWVLSLLRRSGAGVAGAVQRTRRRIWGQYPEDPVRRTYTQLLRRAAAAGLPRPPDATPDEFGRRLASRWPGVAFDLGAITEAYVLRRYGEAAPGTEALDRLGYHWQQVRTVMRVPRTMLLPSGPIAATPDEVPSTATPARGGWPRELLRRTLAPLTDPASGVRGTLLVWLACLLIPFALAILLLLVLLLFRL